MNNIWKRGLSLFLAVVMMVGMVPMGVFATEQEECAHINVEYIDESATCVWEGYYAEYCYDCEQYLCEELLPALGHSWDGNVCTVCGETQAVEETEQEPEEETEEEEPLQEIEVTPAEAGNFALRNDGLTGIVWLDKERDNDLMTKVTEGGLRDMVLTAVGMEGSSAKVYYNSKDGSKRDVSSLLDLAQMYEELKDVLTGEATLTFTIGSGASAQTAYITLKNIAHLRFNISIPNVKSEGEPADITAAVQKALDNAVVTVTHGSDEIVWEALADSICTYEVSNPGEYTWPELTKSAECAGKVTISICDSVDGTTVMSASANVVLEDTTPVYTINFISNGSVWQQYKVLKNHDLDVDVDTLIPDRAFYTFNGWNAEIVTEQITASATYEAQWTPELDNNENGTADQEEFFNVTFKSEGQADITSSQRYGSATVLPAEPTREGYNFMGWAPENDPYGLVAEKVTEDAVYVANWAAAEKLLVVYTVDQIGGESYSFTWELADGKAIEKTFDEGVFDGWYLNGEEFDFDKTVTEEMASEGKLYLTGTLGYDNNGDGEIDGTEADPYINYTFQVWQDGEWITRYTPPTYYTKDEATKVDTSDVSKYKHTDTLGDYGIHTDWQQEGEAAGSEYSQQITMRPVFEADFNNNRVLDTEETAQIVVPEGASVETAGMIEKPAGVLVEGDIPNLEQTGVVTMELGTVEIPGLQDEGYFLYNSAVKENVANNVATTIVARPAQNCYVSKFLVNGVEQEDCDNDPKTFTVDMANLKTAAVALMAETGVKYTVEVAFEKAEIQFKDAADPMLTAGASFTEEEMVKVYDAVVNTPASENADAVSVSYVARHEETVTVSVKGLRQDIEHKYGKLGEKIVDSMWPGDTVEVKLTELVKPITYQHSGMVKTPQQVADSYIMELQSAGIAELAGVLATLDLTIQSKVKESANIRPFLYNENGTSFEETIVVEYKGNNQVIEGSKTFTLADNRTATSITAGDKSVKYNAFTNADLLKGVTLNGVSGEVKLTADYEGLSARTYLDVPVYYAGDAEHQPSQASFDLTIQKHKVNKLVVDNVIVEKHDDIYNAAPVVDPANVDVISVVAGLDLNDLDLDLSKTNPYATLKNIDAKAWIKLPENLKEVLSLIGVDTSVSKSYTLAEIEELLEENADTLATMGVSRRAINAIVRVLNKVNDYVETESDIEIFFSDDVYPTNPGVYVNLAVTADPSYETAYDYGTILIAPVVALPNRGGVALMRNGIEEHLFAFNSNGEKQPLDVYYNGSPVAADVYYYGFNVEAAVHSGKEAPSLPGVYIASTIYTETAADGQIQKVSTDAALMVIGMTDVDIDVAREVVVVDGEMHRPDITVTDKSGNEINDAAVTVISGSVNVDTDEEIGLNAMNANVNIEFPNAVHNAWKKFFQTLNNQDKINLPNVNENLETVTIDPDTLVRFLNWCSEQIDVNIPFEKLEKLNVPEKYIEKAEGYSKATINKLIAAAEKLAAAADKLPDGLSVTFEKNKQYDQNGVYLYYGIVTDPDYIPAANAGLLVIKADENDFVLYDTHTPYTGKEQKPEGLDNTGYEGFTMVVDKKANTVNLVTDDHMLAAINKFQTETGITLDGKTVSGLYNEGVDKVEKLVSYICSAIYVRAEAAIKSETAEDKLDEALALLDTKLANVRGKLEDRLVKLKESNTKILINAELPVNVGTYDFFAYSYAIATARAKLVIEPIYVRVDAKDVTKTYDGKPVEKLDVAVSYYSYKTIGDTVEEVAVTTLPDGITADSLGLKYSVSYGNYVDAGEYPITVTAQNINVANFEKKVDVIGGTVTINPCEIEVTVDSAEKYYGNAEPAYTSKITKGTVVDGDNLEFVITRQTGEDVGTYDITAALKEQNDNYNVTVKDGKLTIKPAEIKIKIENAEKAFDATENPEFEWDYEIVNGLSELTEEQLAEFIKNLKIVIDSEGDAAGIENLNKEYPLYATHVNNDADTTNDNLNVTITCNDDAVMTITYGDYVCWNMQTGVYYDDLSDALLDVDDENTVETIQMLKDFTETDYIIIAPGTTLDLDVHTVTAMNHVVGFEGSYLDGNVFDIDGEYGKLITQKTFNLLTDGTFEDDAHYSVLPIYFNGAYVFTRMEVNTDRAKDSDRGLWIDEENKTIDFQFVTNMTGDVRTNILNDGADSNKVKIIVRLEWQQIGNDDIAYQDFVYSEAQIEEICGGDKDFGFTMNGYDALSVDIDTLKVKGLVLTDCGAVEYGEIWTK